MRYRLGFMLLFIGVAPGVFVFAQVDLPHQRLVIKSEVLEEDRVVLVRIPRDYDTNGNNRRFPVLYMTDGADQLDHTCSTIDFLARNDRMPDMIVVAIINTDRLRDLSPTKCLYEFNDKINRFPSGGGAEKFLKFVETELFPLIETSYRTQPYRVFAGHSLGGLLALHAFATKYDLFNAYIAVSPATWWDNEATIQNVGDFLKDRKGLNRRLFIALGKETPEMLSGFNKLKELLTNQQLEGFAWDSALMEDEDHDSVVLRSHYLGLRKIFEGWYPSPESVASGMVGIEDHYRNLRARFKFDNIMPSESTMNLIGWRLVNQKKSAEAIDVLKWNVKHYPNSTNVYESLGEAYETFGDLESAQSHYQLAVERGEGSNGINLELYRANLKRVTEELKSSDKPKSIP